MSWYRCVSAGGLSATVVLSTGVFGEEVAAGPAQGSISSETLGSSC